MTVLALDPNKPIANYQHNIWNDEMPQSTVHTIIQTHDGYIWLGTYEGVVRFDGIQFVAYNSRNTPQLNRPGVVALYEDRSNNLWIGMFEGGLCRFNNGQFTPYTTENGLSNNNIRAIYEDKSGNLWVATDNGLNQFRDNKFTIYNTNNGLPSNIIRSISEDARGNLYIGTEKGLVCWRNGEFINYNSQTEITTTIRDIYPNKDGSLWLATPIGVILWKDTVQKIYSTKEGLDSNNVRVVLPDKEGNIWIGTTSGGLSRLYNNKIENYQVKDGLSNDDIRCIFEDREGNLWVGTTAGLNQFRNSKFTAYTVADGLANDFVRVVLEDSKGNIWIGTDGGGLSLFSDGKFSTFSTVDGLINNSVRSLYEDRNGDIWIGTNDGISHKKGNKFINYTTKEGLSHNSVYCIYQDREGNYWFGTNGGGINLFKNGEFTHYGTGESLLNASVRMIFEDRQGNIWFGTYNGLTVLKEGSIVNYTGKDEFFGNSVLSGYQDAEGDIWFTTNNGFNRLKNGKFISYRAKTGLFDGIIFQILEDNTGYFWGSTAKGIIRVKKSDFDDYDKGMLNSIPYRIYGKIDGMKTNQCNGASQPCAIKTKNGHLWFATAKGVATIDPDKIKLNSLPPSIYLTEIVIDGQIVNQDDAKIISPGKEKFEFHYTGLSFSSLEKIKFKYLLKNLDNKWVNADSRRVAYYNSLPAGDYEFKVIACNNDGIWNEAGATFGFTVKPFFYKTWWAYGLYIFGCIGLGYGAMLYQVQRVKKRNELLEAKVTQRTKELAAKNDELVNKNAELEASNKRADRIFSALAEALPGTILDNRYSLDKKIGSGGFGAVYKATQLSIKRPVAIKVFKPTPGNDSAENLERFRFEAISTYRVNHPNAISILDSGVSSDGIAYIVMELLKGVSLKGSCCRKIDREKKVW